jgi:DNA-3-methyladenine glycosylase II
MSNTPHPLESDPHLGGWIQHFGLPELKPQSDLFSYLIRSIIAQQLSTKAAQTIERRFEELVEFNLTPSHLHSYSAQTLREAGISQQKAHYIHHACLLFIEHGCTDDDLHAMDDQSFIKYITQIKGVGTWTAEMMLIFGMGRQDVFPMKDLGIQQAMCRLFEWPQLSPKQLNERMIQASAMWAPYRTYAALTLWRYKDEVKSI